MMNAGTSIWNGRRIPSIRSSQFAFAGRDALIAEDLTERTASHPSADSGGSGPGGVRRAWSAARLRPSRHIRFRSGAAAIVRADDQDRFLEPWIEAGQIREVGAVFTVGVDQRRRRTASIETGAESTEPIEVQAVGDLGRKSGPACRSPVVRSHGVVLAAFDPPYPVNPPPEPIPSGHPHRER